MTDEQRRALDAHLAAVIDHSIKARALLRPAPDEPAAWQTEKARADAQSASDKTRAALARGECPACGAELRGKPPTCVPCQVEYQ